MSRHPLSKPSRDVPTLQTDPSPDPACGSLPNLSPAQRPWGPRASLHEETYLPPPLFRFAPKHSGCPNTHLPALILRCACPRPKATDDQ